MKLFDELEKQIPFLATAFTDKELEEFKHTSYQELSQYYPGFGTWIENCILTQWDPLYRLFMQIGVTDKRDMVTLMIHLFYLYQREKENTSEEK